MFGRISPLEEGRSTQQASEGLEVNVSHGMQLETTSLSELSRADVAFEKSMHLYNVLIQFYDTAKMHFAQVACVIATNSFVYANKLQQF